MENEISAVKYTQLKYRKIPKISPSMYKPLQIYAPPPKLVTQKILHNISPRGVVPGNYPHANEK